jgi:exodeoxyribonuclease-5
MNLTIAKTNHLYPQQNEAIQFLKTFIKSDDLLAVLSGYAGTGKTHLLKHFLNHEFNGTCCVTAPTHKAVRVIENVLNRKGKTLHSLLGLRLNTDLDNFDIANPQFDPKGNEYIKNYNLIIIDECSQINKGLYTLIVNKAQEYKVKILFIGDFCQLPPVKEEISITSKIENKFELTEIIRQKEGNPLLILLDLIRNDIINNTETFLPYIKENRKNIQNHEGYILCNDIDFKKYIMQYYKHKNFFNNVDFVRTVAWTNQCIGEWNKYIRNNLFNNPTEILADHDLLTAYVTIVDEFNTAIITNSEDYIIKNIRNYTDSFGVKNYVVNLQNVKGGLETSSLQIVNPHDKNGFIAFYNMLSNLHYRAINSNAHNRKSTWKAYYDFKDKHLSMFTFKLDKERNNNSFVKKDIDYGYAITCHKSQGSTYDNICIDLEDIAYNKSIHRPNKLLRDKMIYVALSRAKHLALIKL